MILRWHRKQVQGDVEAALLGARYVRLPSRGSAAATGFIEFLTPLADAHKARAPDPVLGTSYHYPLWLSTHAARVQWSSLRAACATAGVMRDDDTERTRDRHCLAKEQLHGCHSDPCRQHRPERSRTVMGHP